MQLIAKNFLKVLYMRCPNCDNELDEKHICSKCGKKIPVFEPGIEVEYKEFKVSEFMEIRRKQQTSLDAGEGKAGNKDFQNRRKYHWIRGIAPTNKKLLIVAITVLLVIAAIIGAFYGLQFLLK